MIDVHCHLNNTTELLDPNIKVISCATCSDNYQSTIDLSNHNIKIAIGTHPWFTDKYDETILKKLLLNHKNIGIGEIGLDGCKKTPYQFEIFKSQFMMAIELNRSVITHCVKKFDELCPFFKKLKQKPKQILLHSFSGTKNDVLFFNKYDCFYSFSDKNLKKEILSFIPQNKLLIETDSSTPTSENLSLILNKIASITNIDKNILIQNTQDFYDNF